MKQSAGLWIDHRRAFVVTLSDGGEETLQILSGVDRHLSRTDGVQSNEKFESLNFVADDKQQREFTGHLETFYKLVHEAIRGIESVLLMGPGEAKGELKKMMNKSGGSQKPAMLEADDKMTNPQIIAKVRKHFLNKTMKMLNK
jgi:hypothetical protein